MSEEQLKTLKEVAKHAGRPAHRIIHLCETGVVCPTVNALGRGSVRRFSREDLFRVLLALDLQDAGVRVPLMKLLMERLDRLLEIREIQAMRRLVGQLDLVSVIRLIGSDSQPVLAWLTPPIHVALVTPNFKAPSRPNIRVDLHTSSEQLLGGG